MEAIKAKLGLWAKDRALIKLIAIALSLILILLASLCISIHMRSNIQRKYSSTIMHMQQLAYQNLNNMTQLFSRVEDPNVDVRYKLIPELKAQYTSAASISAVLNENAAKKYAVLNQEQIAAFDAAFEAYAKAYRSGSPTGLAQADMALCMADVQEMVNIYFAPDEDEDDDVVIINAASGKIENPENKQD